MSTQPWQDLRDELDQWAENGRIAHFWWRDDDAVKPGPLLERLAETAAGAPVSLAVIPAQADPLLQDALDRHPSFSVIQHGYAHQSHAGPGEKKCEFPESRDAEAMLTDLQKGRERLAALFGPRFRPALAPPWNRIADSLPAKLDRAGLSGLSTYRRANRPPGPRCWIDTHCDIIAWRTTRGFIGDAGAFALVTEHLRARRKGEAIDEPTGVMTHHIVHDEACWTFLRQFAALVAVHPAAAWCDPFSDLAAA
ncbi:polysaccharide deacetylase family protein [Hwanghaeella sp.]|uniref:polysaccharide deacetylase family protein n=1 Tax=Hwanghaeella sp. TaxID=2605943 RepID=UPI003CCBB5FB